jgi:hypothetical protein
MRPLSVHLRSRILNEMKVGTATPTRLLSACGPLSNRACQGLAVANDGPSSGFDHLHRLDRVVLDQQRDGSHGLRHCLCDWVQNG